MPAFSAPARISHSGRLQLSAFLALLLLLSYIPGALAAPQIPATTTITDCTEAGLDAALATGGSIAFNCRGTLTITFTSTKVISRDTEIYGLNNGYMITLTGGGAVRLFQVNPGVSLTLRSIALRDGIADLGGAVWSDHGEVTIEHAVIANHRASTAGAVYSTGGSLTIRASEFSDNQATGWDNGSYNLFFYGGAVYSDSGTLLVENSTFARNTAPHASGGGIFSRDKEVTVTGSTFRENGSTALVYEPPANQAATFSVRTSLFQANTGEWSGALRVRSGDGTEPVTVKVANSTFTGNSGNREGGAAAIVGREGSTAELDHLTFTGNKTTNGGGGLAIQPGAGQATLRDSVLQGNQAGWGGALSGIGVRPEGNIVVDRVRFLANRAGTGGAADFNGLGGPATITDSTFQGNLADNNGGAVSFQGGRYVFEDSAFLDNRVEWPGGVYPPDGGTIWTWDGIVEGTELRNNTFAGNSTKGVAQAVLLFTVEGGIIMTHNTVVGNTGSGSETLIHNHYGGAPVTLRGNLFGSSDKLVCSGNIVSLGSNLFTGASNNCPAGTGDKNVSDPGLGPLTDNGGWTKSYNLRSDSPALNAAAAVTCPALDQRGIARPQGAACDIGSVEANHPLPASYGVSGRVTDNKGQPLAGVKVSAGPYQTLSNASGYYTITNMARGDYTLVPASTGFGFVPAARTLTLPPAATGQDFVGTAGDNGGPVVNAISPTSVRAGLDNYPIYIDGSNFGPGSKVRWNGEDLVTYFHGPNRLKAMLREKDLARNGKATVTVYNPPPGGGTSAPFQFTVTIPETAIDITISLYNNPTTAADREKYQNLIRYFADGVYEESNGANRIRRVTLYPNRMHSDTANISWTAKCHPNASPAGWGTGGLRVNMCDVFEKGDGASDHPFLTDDRAQKGGGYTLAHEWGHYYYGLFDEYRVDDPSYDLLLGMPHTTDRPVPRAIMDSHWLAVDGDLQALNFSNLKNYDGRNFDGLTAQERIYEAPAWDTLVRLPTLDPQSLGRDRLPRRTYHPELVAVAPKSDEYSRIDLPGPSRDLLQFVWEVAPSPENLAADSLALQASLASLSGNPVAYPEPAVLQAVLSGDAPVAGASATGALELPDGSVQSVLFVDDGSAPDIHGGDGRYSAIMPYTVAGTYKVSVSFTNPEGQARMVWDGLQPALGVGGQPVPMPDPQPITGAFQVTANLNLDVEEVLPDDHGDTAAEATTLATDNGPLPGKIDHPGDADWFRLRTPATGSIVVRLANMTGDMQPRLRALAADGVTELAQGDLATAASCSGYLYLPLDEATANSDVLLEVTHLGQGEGGTYEIGAGAALRGDAVCNPLPALTAMSPGEVDAGTETFTLAITGTHFIAASTVQVDGHDLATTFVDAEHLQAPAPADLFAKAGAAAVTVWNPGPGGGPSNSLMLPVIGPAYLVTYLPLLKR